MTSVSLDSSRLWDFAYQVSAFSAPLSGGSSPARSFPIKMYNWKKKLIHGHFPSTNQTYIESTVLYLQFVELLIYFLNIPSLFNLITNYYSIK